MERVHSGPSRRTITYDSGMTSPHQVAQVYNVIIRQTIIFITAVVTKGSKMRDVKKKAKKENILRTLIRLRSWNGTGDS